MKVLFLHTIASRVPLRALHNKGENYGRAPRQSLASHMQASDLLLFFPFPFAFVGTPKFGW